MAGRLRVYIEAAEDLRNPQYRMGDYFRRAKQALAEDDEVLKEVTVQVGFWNEFQETPPFSVPQGGTAKVDAVLFVKRPPNGEALLFRVMKGHRVQRDAMIGEASLRSFEGRQRLWLTRGDKQKGKLTVDVSDGLPSRRPPSLDSAPTAAGASPRPPAKAVAPAPPSAAAGQPAVVGGEASPLAACGACLVGFAQLAQALAGLLGGPGAFLAFKAKEPGVVKLRSGLMYKMLKKGRGQQRPKLDSVCECHYKGTLVNGTVFDSSHANNGGPIRFATDQVIRGWSEALQLMVEGDKWELYVPPALGYGERGMGPIPPQSVLIFQLELIRIHGGRMPL